MRTVAFESLGGDWFAATDEQYDETFLDVRDVDADRFDALPKADRLLFGALAHGEQTATLLQALGTKMGSPEIASESGQMFLYRLPAKAQEMLARSEDDEELARKLSELCRKRDLIAPPVITRQAASELRRFAKQALDLDAWVWTILDT